MYVSVAVEVRPHQLRDLIANAESEELRARLAEMEARAIQVRVHCSLHSPLKANAAHKLAFTALMFSTDEQ